MNLGSREEEEESRSVDEERSVEEGGRGTCEGEGRNSG